MNTTSPTITGGLFLNNLPQRKPTRLKNFDYARGGAVFVTICVQDNILLFSDISKNEKGECILTLTEYGEIAKKHIEGINLKYPLFTVDNYVIMPNHFHIILTKDRTEAPEQTTSRVIGWLKYAITSEINKNENVPGRKIFQRSFYDHIIEGIKDYMNHWNYIYENPFAWKDDFYFICADNDE